MTIIISLLVALMVAGGVVAKAENALPGSALYGVKISLNEEFKNAIAFTEKSDAKVDAERAERRLEEAEELAVRNELSATVRAELETRFEKFADRMETRVAGLVETDARASADLAANFAVALDAHANILEQLAANASGTIRTEAGALAGIVRKEREDARVIQISADAKVTASADVESAARGRLNAAENKIAEVRAFIKKMDARISAQTKASAEARLTATDSLITAGKSKLDAGAFGEAFVLFGDAHAMAQEAKLMLVMNQSLDLEIDVDGQNDETPNVKVTSTEHSRGILEFDIKP